jgi:hypothetical protein
MAQKVSEVVGIFFAGIFDTRMKPFEQFRIAILNLGAFFRWHAACSYTSRAPARPSERQDIMNLKVNLGATALAVGLLGAAQTGHAAIIVTEGASGTGQNVEFNSCNAAIMSGRLSRAA